MNILSLKATGVATSVGLAMTISVNSYALEADVLSNAWLTSQTTLHSLIEQANALWQAQKGLAEFTVLSGKADPTLGVVVGKNNRENVVGLTFSMPLNVRNDYANDAKAQAQQALAAQANFYSAFRQQKFKIPANTDSLMSNNSYLDRWQQLMAGRGENSAKLLDKQWRAGDLNTSDYLLAQQQRADGLYAGIELQTQYKLSEVQWLLSVGQIRAATTRLNK